MVRLLRLLASQCVSCVIQKRERPGSPGETMLLPVEAIGGSSWSEGFITELPGRIE